jgi:hypothetical protein
VATEAEARGAVDHYVKLGYVQIKIYSSVKPELVPAIIEEAKKRVACEGPHSRIYDRVAVREARIR